MNVLDLTPQVMFSEHRDVHLLKVRLHKAMYWVCRMSNALLQLDRSRLNTGFADNELGYCLDRTLE